MILYQRIEFFYDDDVMTNEWNARAKWNYVLQETESDDEYMGYITIIEGDTNV